VDAIDHPSVDGAGDATFRIFILKLVSFCNLNCSYCYMFNSLDQSHAEKPRFMPPEIAVRSLRAIEVHLARSGRKSASITLHGGEPTLWPVDSFRTLFAEVERLRDRGLSLDLSMQTNLWQRPKAELLELCVRHRVGLGVSLDGPPRVNDANRTDFAGHGTYDRILQNVRWLIDAGFGELLLGFLCVMQPDIEPEDFLEWVASLPVTQVDLLWPIQYTAENPPWTDDEVRYRQAPRYGRWLESLFEAWWLADRPEWNIQLFTRAVEAELGGRRTTDMLGAHSFSSVVVNTDGAIEMADYFRTARDGGSSTRYSILADEFDALARDKRFQKLHRAARTIPTTCRSCRHVQGCRGGTLSGRLNASGEVAGRRSVLCHDHLRFFDTVARHVEEQRLPDCAAANA
jgi:uncharacterized protein